LTEDYSVGKVEIRNLLARVVKGKDGKSTLKRELGEEELDFLQRRSNFQGINLKTLVGIQECVSPTRYT
jgi:hypothetical protein